MKTIKLIWYYVQYLLLPIAFIVNLIPSMTRAFKHAWYGTMEDVRSHQRSKRMII